VGQSGPNHFPVFQKSRTAPALLNPYWDQRVRSVRVWVWVIHQVNTWPLHLRKAMGRRPGFAPAAGKKDEGRARQRARAPRQPPREPKPHGNSRTLKGCMPRVFSVYRKRVRWVAVLMFASASWRLLLGLFRQALCCGCGVRRGSGSVCLRVLLCEWARPAFSGN